MGAYLTTTHGSSSKKKANDSDDDDDDDSTNVTIDEFQDDITALATAAATKHNKSKQTSSPSSSSTTPRYPESDLSKTPAYYYLTQIVPNGHVHERFLSLVWLDLLPFLLGELYYGGGDANNEDTNCLQLTVLFVIYESFIRNSNNNSASGSVPRLVPLVPSHLHSSIERVYKIWNKLALQRTATLIIEEGGGKSFEIPEALSEEDVIETTYGPDHQSHYFMDDGDVGDDDDSNKGEKGDAEAANNASSSSSPTVYRLRPTLAHRLKRRLPSFCKDGVLPTALNMVGLLLNLSSSSPPAAPSSWFSDNNNSSNRSRLPELQFENEELNYLINIINTESKVRSSATAGSDWSSIVDGSFVSWLILGLSSSSSSSSLTAYHCFQSALTIAKRACSEDLEMIVRAYEGRFYYQQSDHRKAMNIWTEVHQYFTTTSIPYTWQPCFAFAERVYRELVSSSSTTATGMLGGVGVPVASNSRAKQPKRIAQLK